MTISSNYGALYARVEAKIKAAQPDSAKLRTALTRIGVLLTAQTTINVRQKRLIDTGRLINSIRYEFFKEENVSGIRVGSFGVPYAAVHEFGYHGIVQVREHLRLMNKAFGKDVKEPRKIKVGGHSARRNIPARSYLRPAVRKHADKVIDILREALTSD